MADDGSQTSVDTMDTATIATATDVQNVAPAPDARLATRGDDIGRYLVIGEIGTGGLGQVLRGYDPDLNREVAIKLVKTDIRIRDQSAGTERSQMRLLREAQAIARLSHPNVVAVYEVDDHEGDVFIAMEYVRGLSLRDWLREEEHSQQDIIEVFLQAGRGLAAAHAVELVHRDFKPSNVLVGDDGRVRVVDFGLARSYSSGEGASEDLVSSPGDTVTVAGAVVGTPAYMAPEQLRAETVDARADQFSFCLSLYEALTGERPVVDPDGDSIELTKLGRLPRRLAAIIDRGLAREPDQRFPSMSALLDQLGSGAVGSRRVQHVATAALVLVVGAAAVLLSRPSSDGPSCAAGERSSTWNDARRAGLRDAFTTSRAPGAGRIFDVFATGVDRYAGALDAMRLDNCRATRVRGEQSAELMDLRTSCLRQRRAELEALLHLLGNAPDAATVVQAPEMLFRLHHIDECANAAGLRSPVPLPAEPDAAAKSARIDAELATIRAELVAARHQSAAARAARLLPAARALGHDPTLARVHLARGDALYGANENAEAEKELRKAVYHADRGRDDVTRGAAYVLLVHVVGVARERKDEGAIYLAAARGVAERLGSDSLRAGVARAAAHFYWWHGDFDAALEHARRSVKIAENVFGDDDARTADALWILGVVHSDRREHSTGKKYLDRALDIYRRILGEIHPKVARVINSLAIIANDTNHKARAIAEYRRAIDIYQRSGAPPLRAAMTVMNLANTLSSQGKWKEALVEYGRAEAVIVKHAGKQSTRYADVLENEGTTLSKLGRHDEAMRTFAVAKKVRIARFGMKHPITAHTMRTIGNAYRRAGKLDQALAKLREAVTILEAAGGADNHMLLRPLIDIGDIELERNQLVAARTALERARAISDARPKSHSASQRASIPELLSQVEWKAGNRAKARKLAERAIVLYRAAKRDDAVKKLERFLDTGKL
jgi:tetratricopeptide (TPR) repeat protein/tRNA A-37 threonylcarbamoyl transferase component Bud32